MPAFLSAVFTSAFLLFLVQPIFARHILPWFGGSPAVWTTCMLCFQAGLLAGYTYAHLIATRLKRKPQVILHLSLIVLSLLTLPIIPAESLKPGGGEDPVIGIIKLLFSTVGLPYILISASGPLLQHWFSESGLNRDSSKAYRLYAVSNFGSLLGLLSYPFLFEPALGLHEQSNYWSIGYGVYALIAGLCGWFFLRQKVVVSDSSEASSESAPRPPLGDRIFWIAAAATGCTLLLAMTNQICQDVAVVPFLWILPLSLYLITFIISFDHDRWYFRPVWLPLAALSVGGVVYLLLHEAGDDDLPMIWQLVIYSLATLSCCMLCHGEMVRRRPAPKYLTGFYLSVALGGVIGGLFVGVIAPRIFVGFWELHVGLLATGLLVAADLLREARSRRERRAIKVSVLGIWAATVVALGVFLARHMAEYGEDIVDSLRGFYGVLRVSEEYDSLGEEYRTLYHGRIIHGAQYTGEYSRPFATTYYDDASGPSVALKYHHKHYRPSAAFPEDGGEPVHIGVIGLGVGTMATHARPGDRVRFYEINSQVEQVARDHFYFLDECEGEAKVVIGDARISLEHELASGEPQQFDLLVVDAFSGDSIPIHLITKEAFDLYDRHLAVGGVLAVHITNRYLDLGDVVRVLAREIGRDAVLIANDPEEDLCYSSDWVLVTDNRALLNHLGKIDLVTDWDSVSPKEILWTDDYSNLLQVLSLD